MSNHMENIHGRNTDKILEDTFEAFICALYKDLGFNLTKIFVINILENITNFAKLLFEDSNYKDRLLRYFQKNNWSTPIYNTLLICGPPHKRSYTIQIINFEKIIIGEGTGYSKKEAEQLASKEGLKFYNILNII